MHGFYFYGIGYCHTNGELIYVFDRGVITFTNIDLYPRKDRMTQANSGDGESQ